MPNEVSAGAVIFRREDGIVKYLLLHYTSGHWDYVKGHMEAGEDELTTVKRECNEETGITDLQFIPGFHHEMHFFFRRNNETISKKVYFYLAETKTAEITLTEHTGYKWLPYEEAVKFVTFSNSRELLKKAHEIVEKL
jgi:8-oxo-dGTP pyrophosphatase MutT (NUDIX family)